jgi:hypothetical protein
MLSQARRRTQASSASDALTRIGAPSSAVLPVSKADGTQRTLSAMEYLSSGTLLKRMKVCGNPRCHCAIDPAARHGPYFEWSYLKAGKLHWQRALDGSARLSLRDGDRLIVSDAVAPERMNVRGGTPCAPFGVCSRTGAMSTL